MTRDTRILVFVGLGFLASQTTGCPAEIYDAGAAAFMWSLWAAFGMCCGLDWVIRKIDKRGEQSGNSVHRKTKNLEA
jgi:hypothetical protein